MSCKLQKYAERPHPLRAAIPSALLRNGPPAEVGFQHEARIYNNLRKNSGGMYHNSSVT